MFILRIYIIVVRENLMNESKNNDDDLLNRISEVLSSVPVELFDMCIYIYNLCARYILLS